MIWKMTIETISDVQGIKVFAAPVADTAVGSGNPGKSTSEDISDLPRLSGFWISHLLSLFRGSVRSFLNPYIEVMLSYRTYVHISVILIKCLFGMFKFDPIH